MSTEQKLEKISKENHDLQEQIRTLEIVQKELIACVEGQQNLLAEAKDLLFLFKKTQDMGVFLIRWIEEQQNLDALKEKDSLMIRLKDEVGEYANFLKSAQESFEAYENSLQRFKAGPNIKRAKSEASWEPFISIYQDAIEVDKLDHSEALDIVEAAFKASGAWISKSKDGNTVFKSPDRKTISRRIKKYMQSKESN